MPGIPPAPTQSQFGQIAKAIDPNAQVLSTRKLVGGLGCRMDLLEFQLPNGEPQIVVTRQYWVLSDPEEKPRLRREGDILRTLAANGVPVPDVVLEQDVASEIFGRPGIVISYLNGKPDLIPEDPNDWATQLAQSIARVHAITVPESLKSLPTDHTNTARKWMTADEPPEKFLKHELGRELWNAMRELWPTVDTSAAQMIHTDFWPGNTLWNRGKLIALIDWEWPALGEPMGDVAYFLADISYSGFDVEDSFLEANEEASGKPVYDLLFWKMFATAIPMPDPGHWAQGYAELGIRHMTADDIRRAHTEYIRSLLEEFHTNA